MAWPPERPRNSGAGRPPEPGEPRRRPPDGARPPGGDGARRAYPPGPEPGYGRADRPGQRRDDRQAQRPARQYPPQSYPPQSYPPQQYPPRPYPAGPSVPEPPGPGETEAAPSASPVRRTLLTLCALVAAFVLLLSTAGWLGLRHYEGKVHHVALTFPAGLQRPESAGRGAQAILLVGSDSREGSSAEAPGQRSDTTLLAYLRPDGTTTLLSFPRDLWVTIPAYTDLAGVSHDPQESKLNAAYAYGGASLLIQTIEVLTGVRIDHYVEVNFSGFQEMTDALGGVTVCVLPLSEAQIAAGANNLVEKNSGWNGHVGLNHLNGMQALAFVRQRYGLPQGDIDRIARQQHFLGALFRQAASSETITHPGTLTALLDATTSALTLDDGTSLADLRLLALRMQGVSSGGVRLETVPTHSENRSGQSALIYDPAELDTLVADMTGRTPTATGVPGGAAGMPVAAAGLLPAGPLAAAGAGATTEQNPADSGGPNPASCVY